MSFLYIIIYLVLFVAAIIFICYKNSLRANYLKEVPGPKPFLCIGNFLDFLGGTEEIFKILTQYTNRYGSTFKIHDGWFHIGVVTTDYNFIELILSSTILITKSDQYAYFHNWLGTGLLTSTGSKWKKRRRMLTPSFHFSILEQYVEIFDSVGDILMTKFEAKSNEPSINICPLISLCTLDIICEAAMGTSVNAQRNSESKYVKNVKLLCYIMMKRVFSPLNPHIYPLTLDYFKEKMALKTVVHPFVSSVIDEKVKTLKDTTKHASEKKLDELGIKKKQCFIDLLLHCTVDGEPLSKDDLMEEVNTFMFEGHDTTSSAITFAMWCIATNPRVQEKIFQEQQAIFGNDLRNSKAGYNDLQQMKYLEMVIKETLRLYPSVPLFGRRLEEDITFNGVLYPKGLNIMIIPFIAHRNPNYFKNPEHFVPERFENFDRAHPYCYIPFSAGPRNCIGQKFAMLEMKSTISKTVRKFELLPTNPPHQLILAPESILVSKNGVSISLIKRK